MNGKIDFDFPGHIWPGLWPRGASSLGRGLSGSVGFLLLAEERQCWGVKEDPHISQIVFPFSNTCISIS